MPDPSTTITPDDVIKARQILIGRMDTHIDSPGERLREPRVRRILAPMIAGEALPEVSVEDQQYLIDLGMLRLDANGGLGVANPVYREVILRYLASSRASKKLDAYLAGLALDSGWLIIFDQRAGLPPIEERTRSEIVTSPGGRKISAIYA